MLVLVHTTLNLELMFTDYKPLNYGFARDVMTPWRHVADSLSRNPSCVRRSSNTELSKKIEHCFRLKFIYIHIALRVYPNECRDNYSALWRRQQCVWFPCCACSYDFLSRLLIRWSELINKPVAHVLFVAMSVCKQANTSSCHECEQPYFLMYT